jgi:hypothetical protein
MSFSMVNSHMISHPTTQLGPQDKPYAPIGAQLLSGHKQLVIELMAFVPTGEFASDLALGRVNCCL